MTRTLEDKIAIVTGGGQGLGQAICLRLAHEGCHVVVADVNEAQAIETADLAQKMEAETLKLWQRGGAAEAWSAFARKYRSEMHRPDTARTIALLALLSQHSDFSVGCYCEDESRCHRSILRALLEENGAKLG